jgi:hypothetical protein
MRRPGLPGTAGKGLKVRQAIGMASENDLLEVRQRIGRGAGAGRPQEHAQQQAWKRQLQLSHRLNPYHSYTSSCRITKRRLRKVEEGLKAAMDLD